MTKIPVVTGAGQRLELDSDGMPRLIVAEACDEIDPQLWMMFVDSASAPRRDREGHAGAR